jgi:phosphatidylserine/phosphatidylglycerophosphate/cardiolipin synthase-like enzyme
MNSSREIVRRSRYARNEVSELLQSIFVAELMKPSRELWLVSPWLSDIEVIDDSAGAFSTILGSPASTSLTLSAALVALARMGTRIQLVTRPSGSQEFHEALERRRGLLSKAEDVALTTVEELHTKGLLGDDYRIMGSMNFTFHGIEINDEAIRFDRDVEAIATMRVEFEEQYGGGHA